MPFGITQTGIYAAFFGSGDIGMGFQIPAYPDNLSSGQVYFYGIEPGEIGRDITRELNEVYDGTRDIALVFGFDSIASLDVVIKAFTMLRKDMESAATDGSESNTI